MRAFINAISFKLLAMKDVHLREGGVKIGLFGPGRPTFGTETKRATLLFTLGKPPSWLYANTAPLDPGCSRVCSRSDTEMPKHRTNSKRM